MFQHLAILLIITLAVSSSPARAALNYKVCDVGSSLAEVNNVWVSDCDNGNETCIFIRGFNKSMEIDFTPKQKIEQFKLKVAGKMTADPVPWLINPAACGIYGIDCPMEAGKPYKFKLAVPVLRTYPKVDINIILRLIDENEATVVCVEFPSRIIEPKKD